MRLLIASRSVVTGLVVVALLAAGVRLASSQAPAIQTVPGMPAVVDPSNLYSETTRGQDEPGDCERRRRASTCRT